MLGHYKLKHDVQHKKDANPELYLLCELALRKRIAE